MIAAIILAAGNSTRMGEPKALLMFRGSTFLAAIRRTCADIGLAPVIVVVGKDKDKILQGNALSGCTVVVNRDSESGPVGSAALAIRAINRSVDGAILWPVDQPHVSNATVRLLVDAFDRDRVAVVVPRVGRRRGHPVIVSRTLFSEIRDAALSDRTLRDVVRADPSRVVEIIVDDPAVLQDIDTPEDYAAMGE